MNDMKSLHLSVPHIIATVGMPGAGKTQFSEKFAETFGAPRIGTDILETLGGEADATNEAALQLLKEFLKSKQTIVYDGASEKRVSRAELARAARLAGYKILFVWVQTDLATAKARWEKLHHSDDRAFEQLMRQFSAPHPSEPYVVISGRYTYSTQAKTVLRKLSAPRAASTAATSVAAAPRSASSHSTANRIRIN